VIKRGDTLWDIAKKEFNDPYQWPILYLDNCQIILDPDYISNGISLKIKNHPNNGEIIRARVIASNKPVFKPHKPKRYFLK